MVVNLQMTKEHLTHKHWSHIVPGEPLCYLLTRRAQISSIVYTLCLSVCLYKKTAEQIGPKFCAGPHVTPGKVYE